MSSVADGPSEDAGQYGRGGGIDIDGSADGDGTYEDDGQYGRGGGIDIDGSADGDGTYDDDVYWKGIDVVGISRGNGSS